MQYLNYNEGQYHYWTEPNVPVATAKRCRTGQRGHLLVTDAELILGGFTLAENVGWENIGGNLATIINGGHVREGAGSGVGAGYWVEEAEITTLGTYELINGAY